MTQTSDRRGLKVWVRGKLPMEGTMVGVDLLVTSLTPMQLEVDKDTKVFPVPVCSRSDLTKVIDLCSGMGGFTAVIDRIGFHAKAGVDQNGIWRSLYQSLHEGATFHVGDLMDSEVLGGLLGQGLFHGIVCSGIACQPHSVLGDRCGMSDPRSESLPKSLHLGWLLQAAVLVLECTPEILRDAQAQELLRQFCVATGYRLTQSVLKLGNTWCTRRDRWIAILTAPVIQICELPDMPQGDQIRVIQDLIPAFTPWHQFDQDQLVLNLYELSKYYQYAAGGMDAVWIRVTEQLPTLLHSAGNQMYTCACGCRAALSEARLKQRGLVGTLIRLGTCQTHMHQNMEHARYLHPLEMWVLMGGSPKVSMGHNLRLAMSGIGQAVSPLMGLWIFAHIRTCLDRTFERPPCQPMRVISKYMEQVIAECREQWPLPVAPTAVDAVSDDPIEDVDLVDLACITLSRPCSGEPDILLKLSPNVTGQDLLAAEQKLGNDVSGYHLRVDGESMDLASVLPSKSLVSLVPSTWTEQSVYAEPVIPCCLDADALLRYARASDASDPGHVTDFGVLQQLRSPSMSKVERVSLLDMQGPVWGDDEVLHGLVQTAIGTDCDQHVHVWDPLMITGLVHHEVSATWAQLVGELGFEATVVSAVALGGHWIPLVWRVDGVGAKLHTLSVAPEFEHVMQTLSRVIDLHRGGSMGVWKAHSVGFTPVGYCGALAIAFVRHLLWGWLMVTDPDSLVFYSSGLRKEFVDFLPDLCRRPYLAGLGVSLHGRLAELLTQHGVTPHEAPSRAAATIKALGESEVGKAVDSANPWKELKWLGNQCRPPFMLVRPHELQAQIDRRSADKPVGQKRHKNHRSKGLGKGNTAPLSVDPTLLRLEHGIFQSEDGQLLSQIGLAQVRSSASGVVVVSVAAIDPYLQAQRPLSSGPLALFVVDAQTPPATSLPVSPQRVPLVCAANSEPLLVDGFLIQLGAVSVCRTPLQKSCEVQSIPTCVVKAMVFRDQTTVPWEDVIAHPMLHIFAQVPPLQSCQDDECCGCEGWHRTEQLPMDSPVMELWGKQWMRLDFSQVAPANADLFTAHIRLPEQLQQLVQHFSGHGGVYLEPKSLDGRKPSQDFQVVWLPKADHAQLMVQRQTVPHVVGLARLGTKMGLRCCTMHAAEVFALVKPGHTFLPPGRRHTYLVGPFAFGTLQASVAKVLHENGWVAKPIQAVAARTHVQGLMFRVQSVQEPPQKLIRMAHGDVVIAKETDQEMPDRNVPKVVATSATESFVSKPFEGDALQQHDPWARAASKLPVKTQTFPIGNPLDDVAQKVLAEVMSKLPQQGMEVDGDEGASRRVEMLEQQVQELQGQTHTLATQVQQHAQESQTQFGAIRGEMQQQGAHFEKAIAAQASAMQGFQDSFQEQFRQQVSHQQTMLDSMFSKQMTQFEHLLSKRPRQE